jgi:hypothetical protein
VTTTDIRGATVDAADPPVGTNPSPTLAIKTPVRVASTGSPLLPNTGGLLTVDGVALNAGDQVLAKDEIDQTTNGIYNAATGPWTRAIDANNNSQWTTGTLVIAAAGNANAGSIWQQITAYPIILGTSPLVFFSSSTLFPAGISNGLAAPYNATAYLGSRGNQNPYTFVTPPGIVYPNFDPLINSGLYAPGHTLTVNNPLAFGNLQTASAGCFTTNSNRPAFINGYTADNEIGTIQEVGAGALGSQVDSLPYLFAAAGTFTATTFVPTSSLATTSVTYPFGGTTTATQLSLLQPNMWLITNDAIPFYGRITNVGTGGAVTVSGWYQLGSSVAGTPAGTQIYANPQNYFWAFLPQLFLNRLGKSIAGTFTAPTGNVASGSAVISNVSDTTGVIKGATISATGVPSNSVVVSYTANSITINQNATGNATGATLTISTHPGNWGLMAEYDLTNSGPAFVASAPVTLTGATVVSGSNTITGLTVPATVRQGMLVYSTDGHIPTAASIISTTPTTITLNTQCTGNSSGSSLVVFSNFIEGGVGIHMFSTLNNGNTAYHQSGSWAYGFNSRGATAASFLFQLDGTAAIPPYGFQADGSIAGFNGSVPFAVTSGSGADLWHVDGAGNAISQSATSFEPQWTVQNNTVDATAGYFIFAKTRGGAAADVSDTFGTILFEGADLAGSLQSSFKISATASSIGTGAGNVKSALSFAGTGASVQMLTDGTLVVNNATDASAPTESGSTQILGGIGVAKSIYAGNSIAAASAAAVPAGGTAGLGFLLSSTADLGVFFGSGAPTLSAAQGSLYLRTDGSGTANRAYVNTNGTTGWTAVSTAA